MKTCKIRARRYRRPEIVIAYTGSKYVIEPSRLWNGCIAMLRRPATSWFGYLIPVEGALSYMSIDKSSRLYHHGVSISATTNISASSDPTNRDKAPITLSVTNEYTHFHHRFRPVRPFLSSAVENDMKADARVGQSSRHHGSNR